MNPAELEARVRAAATQALHVIAEDLLGRAQREAPVDTGALRGSGTVELQESASGTTATVSFTVPYAAVQHEHVEYAHPNGGNAKYLEGPLKEMAPRYEQALGEAVRRALHG